MTGDVETEAVGFPHHEPTPPRGPGIDPSILKGELERKGFAVTVTPETTLVVSTRRGLVEYDPRTARWFERRRPEAVRRGLLSMLRWARQGP